MSLTDSQLYELSKKMNFPLERVCFKDELDDEPLVYNKGYIVNMEDEFDANGYLNSGSHWVAFQVNKNPNGTIEKMFFDSYGKPPAVAIEKYTGKIPYSTKNIQSAMSEVCGWFCCAFLHWINAYDGRTKHFYTDCENFLELFLNLDESSDWKQNEYMLKNFFRSSDPSLRKEINVWNSQTI